MKDAGLEHRVRQISWPQPTAQLRERVLAAMPLALVRITWSDRLWFSRRWRVTCAVVVFAALALAASHPSDVARLAPPPELQAEAQGVSELGSAVGLTADLSSALARRTLDLGSRRIQGDRQELAVDMWGDRR